MRNIDHLIVDVKADYYVSVFKEIDKSNKNVWNWGAFFGGEFWLLFRGLTLHSVTLNFLYLSFLLVSVFFILPSSEHAQKDAGNLIVTITMLLFFIPRTILGFYGNRFYYQNIKHKIINGYQNLFEITRTTLLIIIIINPFGSLFKHVDNALRKTQFSSLLLKTMFPYIAYFSMTIIVFSIVCYICCLVNKFRKPMEYTNNKDISEENIKEVINETCVSKREIMKIKTSPLINKIAKLELSCNYYELYKSVKSSLISSFVLYYTIIICAFVLKMYWIVVFSFVFHFLDICRKLSEVLYYAHLKTEQYNEETTAPLKSETQYDDC